MCDGFRILVDSPPGSTKGRFHQKILLAHKSCGRSVSSFYSNISPAARLGTMIAGSETASEASWTSFQTQAHPWEAIERPVREFKMPGENFRACRRNPVLFLCFFLK